MPSQQWKCPFCSTTSARPQGLAAHIRYTHTKQYPKWLKNPQRLGEARQEGTPELVEDVTLKPTAPASKHIETAEVQPIADNATEQLLLQAHAQLIARKEIIESELARLDELRGEMGTIERQLESLDSTLAVFKQQPSADTEVLRAAAASSKGS
jgi:hypothetical protein